MDLKYTEYKDFHRSLNDLYHKGGQFQNAAIRMQSVVYRALSGIDEKPFHGLKMTNHGENRINKCIKYDFNNFSRLITIQDSNVVMFCYAGDHNACDKWIKKNRGATLIDKGGQIQLATITSVDIRVVDVSSPGSFVKGKLFEHINPESYFDLLVEGLPRGIVRDLERLESFSSEQDIFYISENIESSDQANAVFDVFSLLRQDKREDALNRIKLFVGELKKIEDISQEEIEELADSEKIKTLKSNDPRFQKVFEHFVKTANYMDWMLFLHPDQQAIVDADFNGPAKLSGVSGSGKTCIVVQRAIRLAEKYKGEKILILTLNRQLSRLISDMVDSAALSEVRENIDVKPFFSLCQDLLRKFEPNNDKLYDDTTWKSKEHVDEIWREFYRCELNVDDAKVLTPLHDSLLLRNVKAESYIRDELDWLRSAVPSDNRKSYIDIQRSGRNYPLDKQYRHLLIDALKFWERKMEFVGVTDYLGLSTALFPYKSKIAPQYRAVIVDETQDFGTIELQLIRMLVKQNENDLFFCGDIAQQVSSKHLSFGDADIDLPGARSLKIKKNYRNSREILHASYDVLVNNITDDILNRSDFEILDPEYANFSASAPLILKGESLEHEISCAINFIQDYLKDSSNKKGCLALSGFSLYQIESFANEKGFKYLNGEIGINEGDLFISDLEHTKGFEFDVVVIVNCNAQSIPDPALPEGERYRDLSRLYVSMTRAKDQLVLSFSGKESEFLEKSHDLFLVASWSEYLDQEGLIEYGIPKSLNDLRLGEVNTISQYKSPLDMTGPEFLYTKHAIGLPKLLIDKIRKIIPGSTTRRNGSVVKWRTLREASEDLKIDPKSRQAFGSEGIQQFNLLIKELEKVEYREKNKIITSTNVGDQVRKNRETLKLA